MLGQSDTIKEFQPRFPVVLGVIAVIFCLLATRMVYLQIGKGQFYRAFSEQNSLRKEKIPGPRGQIFDRFNRLLVDNRLQPDITITPQFVKNPKEVITNLAKISGQDPQRLFERYRQKAAGSYKFQPISIIENAPWDVVVKIESSKAGLAGIEVEPRIRRTYLNEKIGAHVFGYLSEVTKIEIEQRAKAGTLKEKGLTYDLGDWIGRSGLEKYWEKNLRGTDGVRFVEVDAHGHRITSGNAEKTILHDLPGDIEPIAGKNLVLTIDEDLQLAAAEAMKGKMGAAVAVDPRTGEVLAMISNPGVDPTEMAGKLPELWSSIIKNPYEPLRNKAIQDHYPSGSTFKIFTALAALDAGIVTEHTTVNCPGFFKFGSRIFNCHKKTGHGSVNLHDAIAGSCDVYFYQIAARLGIDHISNMAMKFGFGAKTGIDLGQERSGLMPTEAWKKKTFNQPWSPGETLSAAIGQGANLVTPLQLATGYATLINGGNFYKPYIVSKVEDIDGRVIESYGPQIVSSVQINPKHLEAIKRALYDVANSPGGTAYSTMHTKDGLISGKSGTAQVMSFSREDLFKPCINLPFEKRHHAWFVGYAPRENPEIVVSVLGLHECGGSRNAAPVVRAVIEKYWSKKQEQDQLIAGPQLAPIAVAPTGRSQTTSAERAKAQPKVPQKITPPTEMVLDEDALAQSESSLEQDPALKKNPQVLPPQEPIPFDD